MVYELSVVMALCGVSAIVAAELYVRTVCEIERWQARRRR